MIVHPFISIVHVFLLDASANSFSPSIVPYFTILRLYASYSKAPLLRRMTEKAHGIVDFVSLTFLDFSSQFSYPALIVTKLTFNSPNAVGEFLRLCLNLTSALGQT